MRAPRHLHPLIGFVVQPINRSTVGFEAQTKKSARWFWGPNHRTVATVFEAQTRKPSTTSFEAKSGETINIGFEAKLEKTVTTSFEAKSEKTVLVIFRPNPLTNCPSGFEAKLLTNHPNGFETKPLTNYRPWFWGSTKKIMLLVFLCMLQTTHNITWPPNCLTTKYPTCVTIPSPLHQVSYSCHDPHCCLSCCTYHLYTMR
jgi:hypothetical protein